MNAEDEERIELRLLSEPEFAGQFDIAVEDLTDAYVAGEIQGEDRKRAETYFFRSAERQEKLKYAQALRAYGSQRKARGKWWTSPQWRIAAAIILMAGVGFGLWRLFAGQDDVDKGLVALHQAYRAERPFEARVSGLEYAPTPASLRGEVKVDESQRKRAESLLEIAVQDQRNAKSLHARGQAYLFARQFDQAIKEFEAALALSNDAKIHSDLGAAFLEKGKIAKAQESEGTAAEYFARAVTHFTKALELDSSLLEALFNRALTYKYVGPPEKAEQDWRQYLEKDPNSQWSNEARQQLKELEQNRRQTLQTPSQIFDEFVKRIDAGDREAAWKIVRSHQNRSGNVVIEQLLDNYLERGIETELPRLASIAEMDLVKNGDHFYWDVLDFYRSASPEKRNLAKQARQLMKESHAIWGKNKVADNLRLFSEAKKLFEEAGGIPEAKHAEYWIAFSHFGSRDNLRKYEDSLRILEPLVDACERSQYVWLRVRCLYLRSSNEFNLNQHSVAVSSAREAAQVAKNTGDSVGFLNVVTSLAEYYRYLGNYRKSLAQTQLALPIISSIALDPIQSSRHYGFAATAFAAAGFHDVALNYQEAALRVAPGIPGMAYQHAFLGAINGKRRNFDAALNEVNKAFEIATTLMDRRVMAYSALQRGDIYREMGDCDKAITSYTESLDLYKQQFDTRIYQAHKGRLLCYSSQKDDARTQQEIETTLRLMENYRNNILEEHNRNTFFQLEHGVYDLAIDFAATRLNNPDLAFEYLQQSRGRTLLDLLKGGDDDDGNRDADNVLRSASQPELAAGTIKDKLPENAQLVQYAVLDDKILIWVISRHGVAFKPVNVPQQALNDTIARYKEIASKPAASGEDEQSLAKELYGLLVQPVASFLDSKKVICIIPDKNLSYVPFGALVSPSGKYAIDEYVLTTSQSPSVFLESSKQALAKANVKEEKLLSVGNPRFDQTAFPSLDDLPNARLEAVDVAKLYKDRSSLLESQATETAVMNEMLRSDVVHLAMHSVLDGELPSHSKLLLAKGDLSAYEIYQLKKLRPRLVVLSSCQSGAERYYDGEGMASLARAFLSAKVPLVVASLWPVDSKATEKLMVSFHRNRTQGSSTAEALANAQREMLRDPENRYRSPFYWAAFSVNGGYAEF
ncbi:MAG TPA: CHAT domain-containing protein [Pyrinomonadaceae bacterium]|nr:CHAT domain-containing protein [Pyrinomonadaceae bacterium]